MQIEVEHSFDDYDNELYEYLSLYGTFEFTMEGENILNWELSFDGEINFDVKVPDIPSNMPTKNVSFNINFSYSIEEIAKKPITLLFLNTIKKAMVDELQKYDFESVGVDVYEVLESDNFFNNIEDEISTILAYSF